MKFKKYNSHLNKKQKNKIDSIQPKTTKKVK